MEVIERIVIMKRAVEMVMEDLSGTGAKVAVLPKVRSDRSAVWNNFSNERPTS